MKVHQTLLALALAGLIAPACFAQVTGAVTLEGEAPEPEEVDMSGVAECAALHPDPVLDQSVEVGEDGGLANVIVYVKENAPDGGAPPSAPAVLDQQGCMYQPHVLAMQAGQPLRIKNSDPFLHNVHSMADMNPAFNFGQPNVDPGKEVEAPKVPEIFHVKCDVHPWMSAYVGVFEHPFFAVTDEKGRFTIDGLPDGEYEIVAWHELYNESEPQTVEVTGGKAEVNFTFDASSAAAPGLIPVTVELASASASAKESCPKIAGCCSKK